MNDKNSDSSTEPYLYFYYIGPDEKYKNQLEKRIYKYYKDKIEQENIQIKFDSFNSNTDFNPSKLFHETLIRNPNIIFVDFSTNIDKLISFGKLIRNDNKTKLFSTVGLFDLLVNTHDISRSLMAGIRINHFKGPEMSAIIYQSVAFYNPKKAIQIQYALAKREVYQTIRQDLRLIYIEDNKLIIETNTPLIQDSQIEILKPSKKTKKANRVKFKIEKIQDFGLFYNSRFLATLAPNQENAIKTIIYDKKNLFGSGKKPKKLKILIHDQKLDVLNHLHFNYTKLPYSINFQSAIHPECIIIKRKRPHLLIYQCNNELISHKAIEYVISQLNTIENYNPYILLFNYPPLKTDQETSDKKEQIELEIKNQTFKYSKLLTYQDSFSWNIVERIAFKLNGTIPDFKKDRFFISSTNTDAIIQIERKIKIIAFDEQNIYFESFEELPLYTVFSMIYPIKMLVTIVPIEPSSEFSKLENTYKGLINLVSEDMYQKIRNQINQIFLLEKHQQKLKEKNEQEILKQEYFKNKQNSEEQKNQLETTTEKRSEEQPIANDKEQTNLKQIDNTQIKNK